LCKKAIAGGDAKRLKVLEYPVPLLAHSVYSAFHQVVEGDIILSLSKNVHGECCFLELHLPTFIYIDRCNTLADE
tara:strand:+ start:19 stop:243 length:225 start_codon:yes stop_codon:yes gene_type:complete